jgi:FlaG/FlaF family flagellin (archaellin)
VPFSQTSTTAAATEEGGEPLTGCAPIGKTVWYRFTPAANMTVTASTQGSTFDTVLVAWRGTALGALTQVGCDDDGIATGGASRITGLALTAGQTYYFQVGGYRYANTTESGALTFSLQ